MKYTIAAFFALMLFASCDKKEQTKDLRITGTIDGLKKGTLRIKRFNDSAWITVDTILFNGDSKFETELDLKSPEMLSLELDRGVSQNIDTELFVFAEPGQMTINTDLERFYSKAKITGSKNNDLYEEYKKVKSRYTDRELEQALAGFNAKKDGKPFSEAENKAKVDQITKMKYLYAVNFARNHADQEIAPYIALYEIIAMYDIANARLPYLDTINNALSPRVAKSKYGKMLDEYIRERKKSESQVPAVK